MDCISLCPLGAAVLLFDVLSSLTFKLSITEILHVYADDYILIFLLPERRLFMPHFVLRRKKAATRSDVMRLLYEIHKKKIDSNTLVSLSGL